jgi:hypothetical protein
MEDYEISEVAKILSEWNPLGDDAERVNTTRITGKNDQLCV